MLPTLSSSPIALESGQAKLWILLIGVDDYNDGQLPSLQYSAIDCQGLAEALTEATQTFSEKSIKIYHDLATAPTLNAVREGLQEIVEQAQPEDSVLFYFSGHGVLEARFQQPVLCLADTEKNSLLKTGLSVMSLLGFLGNCQAKQQAVWLDTCHRAGNAAQSNPAAALLEDPTAQLIDMLSQRAARDPGFHAFLSCDSPKLRGANRAQQSWKFPDLGHGLFTYFLIKGLRGEAANSQRTITADGLCQYVSEQVAQYIEQTNQQLRLLNQQRLDRGETQLQSEYRLQTPKSMGEANEEFALGIKPADAFEQTAPEVDEFDIEPIDELTAPPPDVEPGVEPPLASTEIVDPVAPEELPLAPTNDLIPSFQDPETSVEQPFTEIVAPAAVPEVEALDTEPVVEIVQDLETSREESITESAEPLTPEVEVSDIEPIGERIDSTPDPEPPIEHSITEGSEPAALEVNELEVHGFAPSTQNIEISVEQSIAESIEPITSEVEELDAEPIDERAQDASVEQSIAESFEPTTSEVEELAPSIEDTETPVELPITESVESTIPEQRLDLKPFNELTQNAETSVEPSSITESVEPIASEEVEERDIEPIHELTAPPPDIETPVESSTTEEIVEPVVPEEFDIEQTNEITPPNPELVEQQLIERIEAAPPTVEELDPVPVDEFVQDTEDSIAPSLSQSAEPVESEELDSAPVNESIQNTEAPISPPLSESIERVEIESFRFYSVPVNEFVRDTEPLLEPPFTEIVQPAASETRELDTEPIDELPSSNQDAEPLIEQPRTEITEFVIPEAQEPDVEPIDQPTQLTQDSITQDSIAHNSIEVLRKQRQVAEQDKAKRRAKRLRKVTTKRIQRTTIKPIQRIATTIGGLGLSVSKFARQTIDQQRHSQTHKLVLATIGGLGLSVSGLAGLIIYQQRNAQIREIETLSASSEALMSSQSSEALVAALKAGHQLQKLDRPWNFLPESFKLTTISTLQQAIFKDSAKPGAQPQTPERSNGNPKNNHPKNNHVMLGSNGTKASMSPDGKTYAIATNDNRIQLWQREENQSPRLKITLKGHTAAITQIRFSPNGKLLASASEDKTVKLWDIAKETPIKTFTGHTDRVTTISFRSDGDVLASGSADRTIKLWGVANGELVDTLKGHEGDISTIRFSPDNGILATGSHDKTIRLWYPDSTKPVLLGRHNLAITDLAFSPDGKAIASASLDKTIKLWTVSDAKPDQEILPRQVFAGHNGGVTSLSFTPTGQLLASGSQDTTIKFWNIQNGAPIKTLLGHRDQVEEISFKPDGKTFMSISDRDGLMLWNLDLTNLLKQGCDLFRNSLRSNPNAAATHIAQDANNGICLDPAE